MKSAKKTKEALSQIERLSQNPEIRRMAISQEIALNMYVENLPVESIEQLTKIPIGKVKGIIETIVQ